jgi:D-psicose/D-tagatose/L-ribulose 3-epimerase
VRGNVLKYAVHAYAWTSSWSNEDLPILDRAKKLGLDAVEIPLMDLDAVDAAAIRERAGEQGLEVLASVAVDEATDPTSESAAVRDRARDFLRRCVERTAEMGATVFTGSPTRRSAGG